MQRMVPDHTTRILTEARGYAELGMWHESWDAILELPVEARMESKVIAMRLLVCIGMARWELGSALAGLIGPRHPMEDREAAGMFFVVRAVVLCAAGDIEAARQVLRTLLSVWPEGLAKVLAVPPLAGAWSPDNPPAAAAAGRETSAAVSARFDGSYFQKLPPL